MKKIVALLVVAALAVGTFNLVFGVGRFDNILSTKDVERATGLTGVKQVPRDPLSAFTNGDLNFVAQDGTPLLMVQIRPEFVFDAMKSDQGYFKSWISGIGEEAFSSPAFDPQFSINIHKGQYVTVITTHIDPKDKKSTVVKLDQLVTIAKIVDERI